VDVATIITNIKSQSLTGNTGAPDDDAKILRTSTTAISGSSAGPYSSIPASSGSSSTSQ